MNKYECEFNKIALENQLSESEKTPCPCYGCCDNPDLFCPEHTCDEDVCESCYVTECANCGKSCCCDL